MITLVCGPMFAGKTTKIVEIINSHEGQKVLVINYYGDDREKLRFPI